MAIITTTFIRLVTPPVTTGVPVGTGDWRLTVEQLLGTAGFYGDGSTYGDGSVYGTLDWVSLAADVRGIEWTRGADEPFGRPRNGTIRLTLDANGTELSQDATPITVRKYNPWQQYSRTRPGNIIRAGLVSSTDIRGGGWIPLWCGIVDSWVLQSQDNSDFFAEVELVETMSALARIDDNSVAAVGAGDVASQRHDRLLDAAKWKFGFANFGTHPEVIPLQATSMASPRLDEMYLTADSAAVIVRSDVTGIAVQTDSNHFSFATLGTRLSYFSADLPAGYGRIGFRSDTEDLAADVKRLVYDMDSLVLAQDATAIVNDHRYARVGGTQQLAVHEVSIGRFGQSTRERSNLISTDDLYALGVARDDNQREALTSIRIDAVTITSTGKGEYYLLVAVADIGNECTLTIRLADPAVFIQGPIRSVTHSVLPMDGLLQWTSTFAVDTRGVFGFPAGTILSPLP